MLKQFNGLKALVVGDVMIDVYSKGVIERMSPEAPVPIVNVKTRSPAWVVPPTWRST